MKRDRNAFAIVVVAEGVKINNLENLNLNNDKPEARLGGISN